MLQRDQFELLSAYLDDEVTPAERRQVEAWLVEDESVRQMYQRLQGLQHEFQQLTVPEDCAVSATAMAQRVLAAVDRRQAKRRWVWGGGAIAALAAAVVASLTGGLGLQSQFANRLNDPTLSPSTQSPAVAPEVAVATSAPPQTTAEVPEDALMIAVNQSFIEALVEDSTPATTTATP